MRVEKATGTSGASVWKLYAGGRLIGQRIEGATTTTTSYFINDHLDSLAVITDEMGAVKERLAYDPWGKRRYADGSDDPTWSITSESNRGFTGHEQMDEVGLVNMNARLYDPEVGRFVSPDPYIQYAEDSQSYNRYAYARNNPLSITDPSGNFFNFLNFLVVAAFGLSQLDFVQDIIQSNPILGALIQIGFAATGQWYYAALGAAFVTSANGGDIGDIIKAAAIAAATAGAFEGIGDLASGTNPAIGFETKVLLHAAVGCASSTAGGGKCASGAASAGFSAAAGSIIPKQWKFNEKLAASSIVGGVAAEFGGGKFANGAVTGAFGYIYNAAKHTTKLKMGYTEATGHAVHGQYHTYLLAESELTGELFITRAGPGGAVVIDGMKGDIFGDVFAQYGVYDDAIGYDRPENTVKTVDIGVISYSYGDVKGQFIRSAEATNSHQTPYGSLGPNSNSYAFTVASHYVGPVPPAKGYPVAGYNVPLATR